MTVKPLAWIIIGPLCILIAGVAIIHAQTTKRSECHRFAPRVDINAYELALILKNQNTPTRDMPDGEWRLILRHFVDC